MFSFFSLYLCVYEFLFHVRDVYDHESHVYLYAHDCAHRISPCAYVRVHAHARVHDHACRNAHGCVFYPYEDARGCAYEGVHGNANVCVHVFPS